MLAEEADSKGVMVIVSPDKTVNVPFKNPVNAEGLPLEDPDMLMFPIPP